MRLDARRGAARARCCPLRRPRRWTPTAGPRPRCSCRSSAIPSVPGLVFTERRADLRRHAGEISFPGGRRDHPGEELLATALREAEEEIGLDAGRGRGRRRAAADRHLRHQLQGPPVRRPDRRRPALRAEPGRGRRGPAVHARRAARRVRDAAPGPPRGPDPHPDLRGRRPPDLGRDGADPRRAARAAGRLSRAEARSGCRASATPTRRYVSFASSSRHRAGDDHVVALLAS